MKFSELLKFKRPLWKHQADVLDRFATESEAALLHEMGTGKTTSAIALCRAKYSIAAQVLPTLIVSPVATLFNWLEEFERNSPPHVFEQVQVLTGSQAYRIGQFVGSTKKIFITNPEAFDMKELTIHFKVYKFKIIVVDELHRFKGHKSKRLASLLKVSDYVENRIGLTGTLILNSYLDIWAPWRFLDKGKTFDQNFFVFRERFFRDSNIGWKGKTGYFPLYVPKHGIESEISALISSKSSRVTKDECLDLPPLVMKKEYVELSKEQNKAYVDMRDELIAEISSGTCVASNALVRVLRLLQILSGYLQVHTIENEKLCVAVKENPRLDRLVELLTELAPQHKVIVWCSFQENYRSIAKELDALEIPYAELTGMTKDRQAEIDRFQKDPKCRVMISNPQAGGVGVNLTAASYAIYYSRGYSLGDRLQSEARCHRGGSEIHKSITLIDLVAKDTLDEDVLSALLRKENFAENILTRLKK